jgi:hypothetical protein
VVDLVLVSVLENLYTSFFSSFSSIANTGPKIAWNLFKVFDNVNEHRGEIYMTETMDYVAATDRTVEIAHSPISWPAIFAGLFVTVLIYVGLICLGLGFGGNSLYDVLQDQNNLRTVGFGAALWTIVSAMIALCSGGHVSGRVAGLIATRVGRFQGLVIASFFFVLMFTQIGLVLGALGGGLSSALSSIGTTAANSSIGHEIIEDAIGDLNLKAPVSEVVTGLGGRLIRGDQDGAINYLAQKSGISREDARARIESFKARFNTVLQQTVSMASQTLRSASWTLFFAILLGSLAAVSGGGFAANYNLREPVSKADNRALRAAWTHT